MSALPLLSHTSPHSIVAWRADGAVTLQQFLSEVQQLAARFPADGHLLNVCRDRYRFSVGLAAAIVTGKISLLPSTHTPDTVRQIKAYAADVFCLTDADQCRIELPQLRYPDLSDATPLTLGMPQIPGGQLVAMVFTSGSTGIPQPHPKTWGALLGSVQAEAARLGLTADSRLTLVGTVPPQHMYGFESTLLLAWHSANAYSHAQPFYPADICQALTKVPTPRLLVSSPVHLRALLDAELSIPEISGVISATAPLSAQLASAIEQRCTAPLMEIYGSTETGQIASRRPTQTTQWQLFPGIRLHIDGDCTYANGAHISMPTELNDRLEPLSEDTFLLHGRNNDLVNIAGKRHSLASLDHILNAIPGVVDGAFFMPDESHPEQVTRLVACVVAPDLEATRLLAALRESIDPVFLPRPLVFVEALPRNHTGKLPRAALQAMLQTYNAQRSA